MIIFRHFKKIVYNSSPLLTMCSCQTALMLNSIPEGANVFVQGKLIGKTPTTLSFDNLQLTDDADSSLRLELHGYQTVLMVLPVDHSHMEVTVNLTALTTDKKDNSLTGEPTYQQLKTFYKDSTKMLNEQFKVLNGQEPNQEVLSQIKKAYQDSGSPYVLDAINLYKNGDKKKAQELVEQGLLRNPWEEEFHIIEQTIKQPAQSSSSAKDFQ